MKVQFSIHFKTNWGQSLNLFLHTSTGTMQSVMMSCNDKSVWTAEINIEANLAAISYQYSVLNPDKSTLFEYGGIRTVKFSSSSEKVKIHDNWRASYGDSPFKSAAFSDCFFKRPENHEITQNNGKVVLTINCPQMEPNRHFAIVGNQSALGNWDVSRKLRLDDSDYPVWKIALDATKIKFPLEYKYLIVDTASDEVLAWGGGPNRLLAKADPKELTIVNDEHFIRTIDSWKGAGVAIPVFSLRSESSFGTGEFNDLKKMVDWAKQRKRIF